LALNVGSFFLVCFVVAFADEGSNIVPVLVPGLANQVVDVFVLVSHMSESVPVEEGYSEEGFFGNEQADRSLLARGYDVANGSIASATQEPAMTKAGVIGLCIIVFPLSGSESLELVFIMLVYNFSFP